MMQKALERPCPNCGGQVYVYKYLDQYDEKGRYFPYVVCVQCQNCGQASHTHDNEDDALHEFYVDMDVTPIKEVPIKAKVKTMSKWIELHDNADNGLILVNTDKVEGIYETKIGECNGISVFATNLEVVDGGLYTVRETYEQVKEKLCQSEN